MSPRRRQAEVPQDWLEAQQPHEPEVAEAQLAGLLRLLEPGPRRVLDLGCGAGRTLVPLVQAGHTVVGIDRDGAVLRQCRANLDLAAPDARAFWRLERGDFLKVWPADAARLDAVLCLGNTIMTVWELDLAIELLGRAAAALGPRGVFVMDDCPGLFWPEVAEGRWRAGVSRDGSTQMVWAADDAIFALRRGPAVDRSCWTFRADDVRMRLWTRATIECAAAAAGLPRVGQVPGAWLLTLRAAGARLP
jgi:SAM-dependent methyltransferase